MMHDLGLLRAAFYVQLNLYSFRECRKGQEFPHNLNQLSTCYLHKDTNDKKLG